MKKRTFAVLMGTCLLAAQALAQQQTVTGRVTDEQSAPLPSVQVIIKGTTTGTLTGGSGTYSIQASVGQVLQFRLIGHAPEERTVGAQTVINVQLRRVAMSLDAVVVTSLGETNVQRALGFSQQTVQGADLAQTQRENFINALQGRVAGVEVTSSSGVPGASASITIRGVSSISSSNQPLMIVDGMPMDNKTLNTGVLASDAPGSQTAFSNRGVDFTNRASDLNPQDIETLVVLKGPEASALYGIDAANGAIVITTKRGKAGSASGMEYSNSFRIENLRAQPELQRVYGPTTLSGSTLGSFQYFGAPYADTTTFYDNVSGFFRTALTQKHNFTFSGAEADNRINYRLSVSGDRQEGVVQNSDYTRLSLNGSSQAQVTSWLRTDMSLGYTLSDNNQPYKGTNGPLIGLLLWPATDDAKEWITAAGTRRRLTGQAASTEQDNPYFSIEKNRLNGKNNRLMANVEFAVTPFSFGTVKSRFSMDGYTMENQILRHPESASGVAQNGILDEATDVTRNLHMQTLFNLNRRMLFGDVAVSGLLGNQVSDYKFTTSATAGQDFLDPNFVSINNTRLRTSRTTLNQRRLVALFGSATFDWHQYLYLTVTGRNDWTSTIPKGANSFFYPSVSTSFVFSEAFPSIGRYMTGKVRAAYAEVGKDARPYAYRPSLEFKTTSNGGYGYGFTGPNLNLKPEFARSREVGAELGFFDDRLGLDVTYYSKRTKDQIVNDIRGSYSTGFILFNLNGAITENKGVEVTFRGTPILTNRFSWDVITNFDRGRGKTLALPNALPESYVSDTWLFGNVRNGTAPGLSTTSLTGFFYLRNKDCELLIDPTTGLPIRAATFITGACGDKEGYDRRPDFTVGVTNMFKYQRVSLNFLVDIRKGGDIFNATEHFLTARGLSTRTLDRHEPRVIKGVLRDGKQDSDTPTPNNIVIIPAVQTTYYTGTTNSLSEELFIEKDINWLRLKDVTLRYSMPGGLLNARDASMYVTATDIFLITNYSGLDPVVNGNTAAVGGSGAAGIDFGNFPMPRGISFGISLRY